MWLLKKIFCILPQTDQIRTSGGKTQEAVFYRNYSYVWWTEMCPPVLKFICWSPKPNVMMHACVYAKPLHSSPTLCDAMDCSPPGSSVRGYSPGKNTGMGCRALLQGVFLTKESHPHLLCLPALAGRFFIPGTTWKAHDDALKWALWR